MGLDASPDPQQIEGKHYLRSESGVVVYRDPEYHPLLRGTDLAHPDFRRKLSEVYPRGRVVGLPRMCSENSEDARTWHVFSPLLTQADRRASFLRDVLETGLGRGLPWLDTDTLAASELGFWWGRDAGVPQYPPPDSLPLPEGNTEVDLTICVPGLVLVFLEAKWRSGLGITTRSGRDQACRNVDVGSWHAARGGFPRFVFLLLTAEPAPPRELTQLQEASLLREHLPHRQDMDSRRVTELSQHVGWLNWDQLPPHH
jgi:hypothetical protein